MYYIPSQPNPSGAYPGPRSNPEPGAYRLTDDQANMVIEHNGFVHITPNEDGTVDVRPNLELWEAWKASLPEPEPEPDPEPTVWDEMASAYTEGVNEV